MRIGDIVNNRPLVKITIADNLKVQEMLAMVDTGFTGELKTTKEVGLDFGLEITHGEKVRLGDNRVVNMEAGVTIVEMEGIRKVVNVLFSKGMSVVGIEFLKKFKYNLYLYSAEDRFELQRLNGRQM